MKYLPIIYKYYPEDDELRRLLLKHSRQVADRCLQIVEKHRELPVKMLVIVCLFVVIFETVFHLENDVVTIKFN